MLVYPGVCIKCGKPIVQGGAPGPHYNHVTLRIQLDDGGMTDMDIAICAFCELEDGDLPLIIEAHNEYFKMWGPMRLNGHVIEQTGRKGRAEIQLMRQGGKCLGCHQPIEGKWIMTEGIIMHEMCNLPAPVPVKQRAVDPEKVRIRE